MEEERRGRNGWKRTCNKTNSGSVLGARCSLVVSSQDLVITNEWGTAARALAFHMNSQHEKAGRLPHPPTVSVPLDFRGSGHIMNEVYDLNFY